MKKSKRIFAAILAVATLLSLAPQVFAAGGSSASEKGTTQLFNGHATYLLQERFYSPLGIDSDTENYNATVSGWDVDYRGGIVHKGSGDLSVLDRNGFEKITMSHKLMSHSGDGLTLETAFSYTILVTDGLYYEVNGGGKTALRLEVKDGYLCVVNSDGTYSQLEKCSITTVYSIKATFSDTNDEVTIWINGKEKGTFDYNEATNVIDEIKIGTTEEQVAQLFLKYVYVYVNYAINENFLSAPMNTIPDWMSATGGGICEAPGAPYDNDIKGYSLPEGKELFFDFEIPDSWNTVSYTWDMLIPEGFGEFSANSVSFSDGKILLDGNDTGSESRENCWYRVEIRKSNSKSELYINNAKVAEGAGGISDQLKFRNSDGSAVILDNITVSKTFEKTDFSDYPATPDTVESDDYHIGMVSYPMWREGMHYGWDLISPYEERTPYLGYYTGGSREVSDWNNKWLLEHGFDHIMYPFARPDKDGPVNFSVRGEELHDGYLNSYYKDQLDFAIMITNPTEDKYESGEEFIKNVTPFIVERYLKNPSYKSIDNRLIVYCYNFKGFASCLGDDAEGKTPDEVDLTQTDMVLTNLNEEAKKIDNGKGGKYDGITFIADVSAGGTDCANNYIAKYDFGEHVLRWRYTWGTDNPGSVITGTKEFYDSSSDYVTSIPMGFDKSPWTIAKVGLMSPEEISKICEETISAKGNDDPNIVLFTCWDEWGEGHFHAPSNYNGFGYLNAVRKNYTTAGEKTNNVVPTEDAKKRMGVLYPEDRQILKIKDDRRVYTADDVANLTEIATANLQNVSASHSDKRDNFLSSWNCPGFTYGSLGGCTMTADVSNSSTSGGTFSTSRTHSGTLSNIVYKVTSPDQSTIAWDISSLNIDLSEVTAIKINGYAENSATMVLYMQTDLTAGTDSLYPSTLRFEGKTDGTKNVTDTILIPDEPDFLKGTIQRIRFNPTAKTPVGSEMRINSVTFYTGSIQTKVLVDDKEYKMVSDPKQQNGPVYIPAYRFLIDLYAYPHWDKTTKTLTVEKDGVTAEFKAGSNAVKVNGVNKTVDNAPYYEAGNLWVPYDEFLDFFGYTSSYDADSNVIRYKGKNYDAINNYVSNGHSWEFDIDGFKEGWAASHASGGGVVKDGLFHVFAVTNDPIIAQSGLNIAMSDAKYAIIKIKKTDTPESGMLRLYDDDTGAAGVVYRFNLSASDEVQEIVIDLTKDAESTNTYTEKYEDLDKIIKIRLDMMDDVGSIYIDSIAILSELPPDPDAAYDYALKAYAFETENLFQLDTSKSGYEYTNMKNSAGTTVGTVLPVTETVDGYNNVLKILPNSGSQFCIFTMNYGWYNGARKALDSVSADNRYVKVSFWYKGIGDTTSFRLENRAGGARDGEQYEVNDVSANEWKYFEGYYDMSKVGNTQRWFSLRVYQTSSGGLYVRDYSYVCLNEANSVVKYDKGKLAIGVGTKDGRGDENDKGVLYIAELKSDGTLHKLRTVDYPMTSKYYMYEPTDGAASIKCMLWDEYIPLTSPLILKKK